MSRVRFDFQEYSARVKPAAKLCVLFHGYGVSAAYMEKVARVMAQVVPEADVICPEAPDLMVIPEDKTKLKMTPPHEALNPPPGHTPDMQREWVSITLGPEQMHRKLIALAADLNAFIDEQRDARGITDKDIVLAGFSMGGAVAMYTAYTRGHEIAGVAGHSNILLTTADFDTPQPTLFIYGDRDEAFTPAEFEDMTVKPLRGFLNDLEIEEIKGLGHRTNQESRRRLATYARRKLGPAGP